MATHTQLDCGASRSQRSTVIAALAVPLPPPMMLQVLALVLSVVPGTNAVTMG